MFDYYYNIIILRGTCYCIVLRNITMNISCDFRAHSRQSIINDRNSRQNLKYNFICFSCVYFDMYLLCTCARAFFLYFTYHWITS